MQKLIVIDNYDSFTYTIKHYFEALNFPTEVIKNDDKRLKNIGAVSPTHIVLSPGPGYPTETGYTIDVIKKNYNKLPILGICLGHQSIAYAFNGQIINADEIMHGKLSKITHNGEGLFTNIPNDFRVTRYHSLVVDPETLPLDFQVTAWTQNKNQTKVIMAIQHRKYPVFGLQYHPEAVLTEYGYAVLKNFCNYSP